jgi:hypothetical protein
MNLFGNQDALIGSVDLFIAAAFVLGSFIFRKSVANDMFGLSFSVIFSNVAGILAFIIMQNVFDVLKYSVGVGLICWLAAGFLLGDLINDGQADGGSA